MIILLFHVLYLVGKFVYQNYRSNKQKSLSEDVNAKEEFNVSRKDYMLRDPEAPQDDDEQHLRFFPPAYVQRYVAVSNILNSPKYRGKLRKVVDFGCAELDFLVYLKNTAGIEEILCVDIDRSLLEASKEKAEPLISEYLRARAMPLVIEICEGSVTHNDKKLEKTDAVICIELIEHLYPDTLEALPYNIFGYIKPKLVVITTPNADFNVLFKNFSGFRHTDHKFEWTRQQFQDWAQNVTLRFSDYVVTFEGICKGPEGTEHLGCCTQMAVFHRVSDKDVHNVGVAGLFKTVVKCDYPCEVDNRSDEQKILDEATYYIRQLAISDISMEEEVPLAKLLQMLKSFHISEDILKSILEEAGWKIENCAVGLAVLVPPFSILSDSSAVEEPVWISDYSGTDEDNWNGDDWNREPGPPINSNMFTEQDSLEIWDIQNWDEESSTVIRQNISIPEDNTYLFDGENVPSPDVTEITKNVSLKSVTKTESNDKLIMMPSVNNLDDTFRDNSSSRFSESVELFDSSFSEKLKDKMEDSMLNTTMDSQGGIISSITQALNRTLDFPAFLSVSRASTSPEPYLLQAVKMDLHFQDDSMCNQSMSNAWMLNNSLDQENTSTNRKVSEQERSLTLNDCDDSSNLHVIYLNKSYKEFDDSDMEQLSGSMNVIRDRARQCQQSGCLFNNLSQVSCELQSNSSMSLSSGVLIENQPQFTSSPKIETRVNTLCKKRRSLEYEKQKEDCDLSKETQNSRLVSHTNESSKVNSSCYEPSISTISLINLNKVKSSCEEDTGATCHRIVEVKSESQHLNNFKDDTLSSSVMPATTSVQSGDRYTSEEFSHTTGLCVNNSPKENQSCVEIKFASTSDTDSKGGYEKPPVKDQESIEKLESRCGSFLKDYNEKTDVVLEAHSLCDSQNPDIINSTGDIFKHAKEIISLESTACVSSFHMDNAKDVGNTTVLKSHKKTEYDKVDCETKCKEVISRATELTEGIELKSFSENVDTPPESWSPEVMDSGYPNTASAPDITPEYDLPSIGQDNPAADSESPSLEEAPQLDVVEVNEVENGDLANNNRDGEGNNMGAVELNDLEDLQPFIDVLENDLENENDIYVPGNGFPVWLLRILNMANPVDVEQRIREQRELRFPNEGAGDEARYVNVERDEGFDGSSDENSDDIENNEAAGDNVNNDNENAVMNDIEDDNDNSSHGDNENEQWIARST